MDKRRLTTLLDVAFVMAMLLILWENLPIPTTPRNPAAFWGRRREIFRALASVLWLLALWTGMYPSWDCAGRVSHHTVYLATGQALFVLLTPYATHLIIESYMGRFSQQIYGTVMLGSAGFGWLSLRALEKDNAERAGCVEASRRHRKRLLIAMGIMLVGLVVAYTPHARQAMWYSVALSAAFLLASGILSAFREGDP